MLGITNCVKKLAAPVWKPIKGARRSGLGGMMYGLGEGVNDLGSYTYEQATNAGYYLLSTVGLII